MKIYTVSFFGHRRIDNHLLIMQQLEPLIHSLLLQNEYVEFLVGRDGDFDQIVSSLIHRYKRTIRDDNSTHVWVLPYLTAEYRDNKEAFLNYYDEIVICGNSSGSYFKGAFQARNQEMVDRSDLVVFFIQRESGGAWQTMKYAKKQRKNIINLNDDIMGGYMF